MVCVVSIIIDGLKEICFFVVSYNLNKKKIQKQNDESLHIFKLQHKNVKIWFIICDETLSYVSSDCIFYLFLVRNLLIDFALFFNV
ncbi:hypothetical protein FHE73_29305 (plasmid) [Bacillus thuringiensis]|nr:hypothetical protein CGQ22_18830 [Bacillus sp. M13(2017)]QCY64784.1 hypothetical protein FHE73_29305 [Bacillus thuringiensis]